MLKDAIKKKIIDYFGLELFGLIQKFRTYKRNYKNGRFARHGIDKILENYLPHQNGFYVELGANDGALASNSYFFELRKNWKGVLVEPSPNLYLSCIKRRGKNNQVFCNACVPFGYQEKFVSMRYSDSMTISESLKLDIGNLDEFIESGNIHLQTGEKTFEFGARAATLNSLLEKANAPTVIDFLSLDVEGAELSVLQGLDFSKYRFKFIIVESREIERLLEFLTPRGYVLLKKITHHDYLFSLQDKS